MDRLTEKSEIARNVWINKKKGGKTTKEQRIGWNRLRSFRYPFVNTLQEGISYDMYTRYEERRGREGGIITTFHEASRFSYWCPRKRRMHFFKVVRHDNNYYTEKTYNRTSLENGVTLNGLLYHDFISRLLRYT